MHDESGRERAANLWMAVSASNELLRQARASGVVEPDGWTIEELEKLVEDLTRQYVSETFGFADPREAA
ncbi:MAG: hypothetical protein KY396_05280 [Actinobacteria bacterium]|nr:hypothetical protein [Actinomycetota bacterium]